MPWITRDHLGQICGHFTNKPGDGNKIPDGAGGMMPEVPVYYEDDPAQPGYDAAKVTEVLAYTTRPLPKG